MLTKIKLLLAALLTAVAAVFAAFWVGKSKGKAKAQHDQVQTQLKHTQTVKKQQLDIAAKPNHSRDDLLNSMRNGEL